MANTNQNQNKTDLATRTTKLHFFPGPSFYGGRAILTEDDESPAVADWMDDDLPVPAHWDDEQRELLVFLLLNKESAKRRDARGNLTWPKEVWEEIVNDFAIVDIDYDISQLKSGFQTIQKEYLEDKRMREFPGFRWDKVSKQRFAMPETWNEYERVYNTRVNIIRWMDKRFLYFDRMHKLHGNALIRDGTKDLMLENRPLHNLPMTSLTKIKSSHHLLISHKNDPILVSLKTKPIRPTT